MKIENGKIDPWQDPEWMLLSYNKLAKASSETEGKEGCSI
jgi:xylan 1,4-beta-xylosidase